MVYRSHWQHIPVPRSIQNPPLTAWSGGGSSGSQHAGGHFTYRDVGAAASLYSGGLQADQHFIASLLLHHERVALKAAPGVLVNAAPHIPLRPGFL